MQKTLVSLIVFQLLIFVLNAQPGFVWTKQVGGTAYDHSYSITLDAAGNIYTTGKFFSTVDFDPGIGVYNLTASGQYNSFVCKFNSAGDLIWAKCMAGGDNEGRAITIDSSGYSYIMGYFHGTTDFDPGPGVFNLNGANTIYILKLDISGNFLWAKKMGGSTYDKGYSIAVDANGNVYTTGSFSDTADFDPGSNVFPLISVGWSDIFVSKLDALGNFIWAKQLGGTTRDIGSSIALDSECNVYIMGWFTQTADFNPGTAVFNLTAIANGNNFICKLDSLGNFIWVKKIGGFPFNHGNELTLDLEGNILATGSFKNTVDFDPGPDSFNLASTGSWDIFVLKLNLKGDFIWAKCFGGTERDLVLSIAVDQNGNVYTAGYFFGVADFDPSASVFNLIPVGTSDVFISKINSSGDFVCSGTIGSGVGYSIAVDNSGNIITTGSFNGTSDFDPGQNIYNLTTHGNADVFVCKLTDCSENFTIETDYSEVIKNQFVISIAPNPTKGKFKIVYNSKENPFDETCKIKIHNYLGDCVYSKKIEIINGELIEDIDLSEQAKGVYFIEIIAGRNTITRKIVME